MAAQTSVREAVESAPTTAVGLAVIVTNDYVVEGQTKPRHLPGTQNDGQKMKKALETLGFATLPRKNLKKDEMKSLIDEMTKYFQSHSPPRQYKSIVFVFSGHGKKGDLLLSQDGKEVQLQNEIVMPLVEEQRIAHVPKLFFIDACRGKDTLKPLYSPRVSKGEKTPITVEGNYMLAYSTIPQNQAWMEADQPDMGSAWMLRLAERLESDGHSDSIQNIVANTNRDLWKEYKRKKARWVEQWQQPEAVCSRLNSGALVLGSGSKDDTKRPGGHPGKDGGDEEPTCNKTPILWVLAVIAIGVAILMAYNYWKPEPPSPVPPTDTSSSRTITPEDFEHFPEPDYTLLNRFLGPYVAAKWRQVGEELGIIRARLDTIQAQYGNQPNSQDLSLGEVFRRWHDGMTSEFSWNKVADVLLSPAIDEKALVRDLYLKLKEKYY